MKLPTKYDKLTAKTRHEVRQQYIKLQNNKCWYCGVSLDNDPPQRILNKKITLTLFPNGFMNSPIHIQHDHDTGLTEGVVHNYCNAVLWEYYER